MTYYCQNDNLDKMNLFFDKTSVTRAWNRFFLISWLLLLLMNNYILDLRLLKLKNKLRLQFLRAYFFSETFLSSSQYFLFIKFVKKLYFNKTDMSISLPEVSTIRKCFCHQKREILRIWFLIQMIENAPCTPAIQFLFTTKAGS